MAVAIQPGQTGTIVLKFTKAGVPVSAPVTGGSVSSSAQTIVRNLSLASDQKTVTFNAITLGSATITYTGPAGSGITATEVVNVIATTADGVTFDESSLTAADTVA